VTKPGVGTNRYAYSFNDPVNHFDPGRNVAPAIAIGVVWGGRVAFSFAARQLAKRAAQKALKSAASRSVTQTVMNMEGKDSEGKPGTKTVEGEESDSTSGGDPEPDDDGDEEGISVHVDNDGNVFEVDKDGNKTKIGEPEFDDLESEVCIDEERLGNFNPNPPGTRGNTSGNSPKTSLGRPGELIGELFGGNSGNSGND